MTLGNKVFKGVADSYKLTDTSSLHEGGALPLFTRCLILPMAKSLQSHQAPKPKRVAQVLPQTYKHCKVC